MTLIARKLVFGAGALGLVALFAWGILGLDEFGTFAGEYGLFLNRTAVAERSASNVVAAVTFDYRGFDTMAEEFILFTAVVGVALLLRAQREEEEVPARDEAANRRSPHDSDAVRELSLGLVAPSVLFGIYVVAHGHLTPGGGFQGGVVLATAPLFMYLGGEHEALRRLSPQTLTEGAEGLGTAGYVIVGFFGLVAGSSFLDNALGLGTPGELNSAGTIPVLNLAVGLAVAAGVVLLLSEFLEQTLEVRRRSKSQ